MGMNAATWAVQGVGAGMSYGGSMSSAKAAEQGAEFEAAQLDQNAGQAQAASQRTAYDERRKSKYAQSRAQALAAASGGAGDPTVVNLIAGIAKEGAYRSAIALYEGDDKARAMKLQASGIRYTGQAQSQAYKTQAMSGFMKLGGSLFSKYAQQQTPTNPSAGALEPYFASWAQDNPYG